MFYLAVLALFAIFYFFIASKEIKATMKQFAVLIFSALILIVFLSFVFNHSASIPEAVLTIVMIVVVVKALTEIE